MAALAMYLVLLVQLAAFGSCICYFPDGSVADDDTPCTNSTSESTCCGQGYACLGVASQFSLCMSTGHEINKTGASTFVRGSCTDQTWRSANCPSVCVNAASPNQDDTGGGEGVGLCPGTENVFYCIDFDEDAVNCNNDTNVILFEETPTILTTIGIAASTTSSSSSAGSSSSSLSPTLSSPTAATSPSSPSSSASTPSTASQSSSGHTPAGVVAGASVGGAIAALVVAGAVFWWLKRRQRQRRNANRVADPSQPHHHPPPTMPMEQYGPVKHFVSSDGAQYHPVSQTYEAPGPDLRHELPAH